jgi:hypothetical protein
MAFAAIFVPNFRLQAVVRCEPELAVRPIALIDGLPPTYPVVAVNHLAARLGVAEGMTKAAATQFPGVEIRPRGKPQETTAHAVLLDVAWSFSPRVEDTAPDTVLIDVDGLASLFGSHENIAANMVSKCAEMGLTVQVAIAANVETANVVARALPGTTVIPEGQEAKFLESLPVHMLSLSEELCEVFERWGVKTCKALASLPVISLSECVGQEGVRVHAIASGNGVRSLVIAKPAHCFEEFLNWKTRSRIWSRFPFFWADCSTNFVRDSQPGRLPFARSICISRCNLRLKARSTLAVKRSAKKSFPAIMFAPSNCLYRAATPNSC